MDKGGRGREILKVFILVLSATCSVIGIAIDSSQNVWIFAEKLLIAIAALVLLLSVSIKDTSYNSENSRTIGNRKENKIIGNRRKKKKKKKKNVKGRKRVKQINTGRKRW